MEKVECPHCKSKVYNTPRCSRCGKEIFRTAAEDKLPEGDDDAFAFSARAVETHRQQAATRLLQIKLTDQLPDGSLPNLKKLAVQPGTYTFLVSEIHEPELLKPGMYDVSKLGLGGGLRASFEARKAHYPVLICTISQLSSVATFALPDATAIFGEEAHFNDAVSSEQIHRALNSLSLLTAEGHSGGARLQMEIRCKNPVRLLNAFEGTVRNKFLKGSQNDQGAGGVLKYPVELLFRTLFGGKPTSGDRLPPITLWHLYRSVRLELMASLRACLRNERIEDLYDYSVEARERVLRKINDDMARSFDSFGLEISRVSAFEFICPKYVKLRERRGDIALDRERLGDDRTQAEIDREKRDLETEQFKDQLSHQEARERFGATEAGESKRHHLTEAGETNKLSDRLAAEGQQRQMERDAARREHARKQLAENERLKLQLQSEKADKLLDVERKRLELLKDKARFALEMNNAWANAETDRQLKVSEAVVQQRLLFLKEYAGLPADNILAIALANDPRLAEAYVAAMNAKNQTEMTSMQERFRHELVSVHGKENSMVHQLVIEAVKQLGMYMTKRAEANQPQVYAGEVVLSMPPAAQAPTEVASAPPDEEGATELMRRPRG